MADVVAAVEGVLVIDRGAWSMSLSSGPDNRLRENLHIPLPFI